MAEDKNKELDKIAEELYNIQGGKPKNKTPPPIKRKSKKYQQQMTTQYTNAMRQLVEAMGDEQISFNSAVFLLQNMHIK